MPTSFYSMIVSGLVDASFSLAHAASKVRWYRACCSEFQVYSRYVLELVLYLSWQCPIPSYIDCIITSPSAPLQSNVKRVM